MRPLQFPAVIISLGLILQSIQPALSHINAVAEIPALPLRVRLRSPEFLPRSASPLGPNPVSAQAQSSAAGLSAVNARLEAAGGNAPDEARRTLDGAYEGSRGIAAKAEVVNAAAGRTVSPALSPARTFLRTALPLVAMAPFLTGMASPYAAHAVNGDWGIASTLAAVSLPALAGVFSWSWWKGLLPGRKQDPAQFLKQREFQLRLKVIANMRELSAVDPEQVREALRFTARYVKENSYTPEVEKMLLNSKDLRINLFKLEQGIQFHRMGQGRQYHLGIDYNFALKAGLDNEILDLERMLSSLVNIHLVNFSAPKSNGIRYDFDTKQYLEDYGTYHKTRALQKELARDYQKLYAASDDSLGKAMDRLLSSPDETTRSEARATLERMIPIEAVESRDQGMIERVYKVSHHIQLILQNTPVEDRPAIKERLVAKIRAGFEERGLEMDVEYLRDLNAMLETLGLELARDSLPSGSSAKAAALPHLVKS